MIATIEGIQIPVDSKLLGIQIQIEVWNCKRICKCLHLIVPLHRMIDRGRGCHKQQLRSMCITQTLDLIQIIPCDKSHRCSIVGCMHVATTRIRRHCRTQFKSIENRRLQFRIGWFHLPETVIFEDWEHLPCKLLRGFRRILYHTRISSGEKLIRL